MPEKGGATRGFEGRQLIGVAGGVFLVLAIFMLAWPRTSGTNPCTGDCSAINEQTTTQVTERGFPLVWDRSLTITDGGKSEDHSYKDGQKLAIDISVLMIPLLLTAIVVRINEQNAHNRD